MTDTRLLAEFRTRLQERAALQPVLAGQEPAAKTRKPGADWFRIENLSAEEASIYIYDEIGFWGTTAQGFVDQLNAVTTPKITVYLNSPGGEVFDGLAIHSALAASKAHVTTWITGIAASMASVIAMAGDTIKISRNAMMMCHSASGMAWGNATTMRAEAELLDKVTHNIADMYAMQTGGTADEWFALIENSELWYTGQEALAAGLVDEITDPDETDPAEPTTNRLSLAAFNYAGRADAPAPAEPPQSPPPQEPAPASEPAPAPESAPVHEPAKPAGAPPIDALPRSHDQAMHLLAALLKG
jgi:ATP-dependent Clp endopeptidase proteolytic subunit ClpP